MEKLRSQHVTDSVNLNMETEKARKLTSELALSKQSVSDLQCEVENLKVEKDRVADEARRGAETDLMTMRAAFFQIQNENSSLLSSMEKLELDCNSKANTLVGLRETVSTQKEECDKLKEELHALRSELAALSIEHAEAANTLSATMDSLSNFQKRTEDLELELAATVESLKKESSVSATLTEDLEIAQKSFSDGQKILAETQHRLSELEEYRNATIVHFENLEQLRGQLRDGSDILASLPEYSTDLATAEDESESKFGDAKQGNRSLALILMMLVGRLRDAEHTSRVTGLQLLLEVLLSSR